MGFHIQASWDEEAQVWVAQGDGLPGLITETSKVEQLLKF
jgi:hypothetical protein